MYFKDRLCIPKPLTGRIIRDFHSTSGHPGYRRLKILMSSRFVFAPNSGALTLARRVGAQCEACQACRAPNHSLKGRVRHFPVPPRAGESVSLDTFTMPKVIYRGSYYDCFTACICRSTGWTVAVPALHRGLTSESVAREMVERWWLPFGVPAQITTDQGPPFVGKWWKTVCASLGIRHVYSQAYHHAANGRAEVGGRYLQDLLRTLSVDNPGVTWVELLPAAL